MEKIYRNVGNFSVEVDDITKLSSDALITQQMFGKKSSLLIMEF